MFPWVVQVTFHEELGVRESTQIRRVSGGQEGVRVSCSQEGVRVSCHQEGVRVRWSQEGVRVS